MSTLEKLNSIDLLCEHCGEKIDLKALIEIIFKYGVIFIVGENDGYLGFTCPNSNCFKTILFNRNISDLKNIKYTISYSIDDDEYYPVDVGPPLPLYYNSFPYQFVDIPIERGHIDSYVIYNVSDATENIDYKSFYDFKRNESVPIHESGYYYSCFEEQEFIPPNVVYYRYHPLAIEELLCKENETILKLFPRYYCAKYIKLDLVFKLQTFAWNNYLSYVIGGKPDIYEKLPNYCAEKERIKNIFEFMQFLDEAYSIDDMMFPDALGIVLDDKEKNEMEALIDWDDTHKKRHARKTIWENFPKQYVQDLLWKMILDFSHQFSSLSATFTFPYENLESLLDAYANRLYESISSRSKRSKYSKQIDQNFREQVEKAEESFPQIKIVSEDYEINRFKIRLSKLIKLKSQYPSGQSVLLCGERGVGKGLFAKAFHCALMDENSSKSKFILFDCSSKDEETFRAELFGYVKGSFTGANQDAPGALEKAKGGSIFFDEIGTLNKNMQQKLLGVLQNRCFQRIGSTEDIETNSNIIYATNRDLADMVENGEFLPDLYDRLSKPSFTIPPLRDRKNDIPALIKLFLNNWESDQTIQLPISIIDHFMEYDWPGNVRELESAIAEMASAAIIDDRSFLREEDIPPDITSAKPKKKIIPKKLHKLKGYSDEEVIELLDQYDGNKTHLANALGIQRSTLHRRLTKISK